MIVVLQRVREASVTVEGEMVGAIGPGLVALVGVADADGPAEADHAARKTAGSSSRRAASGRGCSCGSRTMGR